MMRKLLLVIALCGASPVLAGTLKKAPVELDPAKAYVVVEIGHLDDALLPGTLNLARYDPSNKDIAAPTPPPEGKIPKGGWAQDNRVFLRKAALKDKKRQLFYVEIQPGLWVIEGANDTAFALGSNTFELAPGSVTDLGVGKIYTDFPEGEKRDVMTNERLLKTAFTGGLFVSIKPKPVPRAVEFRPRVESDLTLPAIFAGARPVSWTGQVEFGNYLGGLVNRMGGIKSRPGRSAESPATQAPSAP